MSDNGHSVKLTTSTPSRLSKPSLAAQTSLTLWSRRFVAVETTGVVLYLCYEGLVASFLGQGKRFLIILSRFVYVAEAPLCEAAIIVGKGIVLI